MQIVTIMGEAKTLFCLDQQGDVYIDDSLYSGKQIHSSVVSMRQEKEGTMTFTLTNGSTKDYESFTKCEHITLDPKVINIGKKKLTLYDNQLSINKEVRVGDVRESYRMGKDRGLVAIVVTTMGEIYYVTVDDSKVSITVGFKANFRLHSGETGVREVGWKVSVGWNANLLT